MRMYESCFSTVEYVSGATLHIYCSKRELQKTTETATSFSTTFLHVLSSQWTIVRMKVSNTLHHDIHTHTIPPSSTREATDYVRGPEMWRVLMFRCLERSSVWISSGAELQMNMAGRPFGTMCRYLLITKRFVHHGVT